LTQPINWTLHEGTSMSNDNRRRPRKQLNVPAWIDVGNDARLQRCTVVDASESGARLAVEDIECLPDKFNLTLSRRGQPQQRCNIVWRRDDEVGIEFIASPPINVRNSESVEAIPPEGGNLEIFAGRLSQDNANEAIDWTVGYSGRSIADGRVSARLLRKVSALLAYSLRRTRHPVES
jgi:PilZ domain